MQIIHISLSPKLLGCTLELSLLSAFGRQFMLLDIFVATSLSLSLTTLLSLPPVLSETQVMKVLRLSIDRLKPEACSG